MPFTSNMLPIGLKEEKKIVFAVSVCRWSKAGKINNRNNTIYFFLYLFIGHRWSEFKSSFSVSIISSSSFRFLKSVSIWKAKRSLITYRQRKQSPLYNKHQLLNEITSYCACKLFSNSPNADQTIIGSAWSGWFIFWSNLLTNLSSWVS